MPGWSEGSYSPVLDYGREEVGEVMADTPREKQSRSAKRARQRIPTRCVRRLKQTDAGWIPTYPLSVGLLRMFHLGMPMYTTLRSPDSHPFLTYALNNDHDTVAVSVLGTHTCRHQGHVL